MSKTDDLLIAFKANLGKWTCAYCGSNSNQPAAIFRELKKRGYKFEEVSLNSWGKTMYCDRCKANRTHYKLLFGEPIFNEKPRISINQEERKRILNILSYKDAFSGASISSTPEIDHKVPWTRLDQDIDSRTLTDIEVPQHFQLLTREHNLLKDRACSYCKEHNIRPPFFDIKFWYKGCEKYDNSCEGCGWYDGNKWREVINKRLSNNDE